MVLVHGLSETLGESMATRLAHVPHIFQVSVPVSVPAFPCFPVAPDHLHMSMNCAPLQCSKEANGMWVIDCFMLAFPGYPQILSHGISKVFQVRVCRMRNTE